MRFFLRKREFFLLIFLIVLLLFSFVIIKTNNTQKIYRSRADENITPTPEASPSAQIALLETVIESKNIETDNLLNKYEQSTNQEEKQSIVSTLETNLTERNKNQISLLKLSPKAVYNKSFSKDKIEKLKRIGSAQNKELKTEEYLNKMTGTVNTTISDDFDHNTSYTTATFIPDDNDTEEEMNFYPTDGQTFLSGTKVTLNDAIRIDEDNKVLGVSSVYAQEQKPQEKNQQSQTHLVAVEIETIETPPLDTLGEQKVLVLLAKAKDVDESQLPTPQEIEDRINGPMKQFYEKNSYGKMTLTAEVVKKWYEMLSTQSTNNYEDITSIITHAVNDNIDIKKYQNGRIMLVGIYQSDGPRRIVGESHGYSSLGKNSKIKINGDYLNFEMNASVSAVYLLQDRESFFSSAYTNRDGTFSPFDFALIHETGHALGIQHARETSCDKNILILLRNNCINHDDQEYGNDFDVMGNGTQDFRFNIYTQKSLKWLDNNHQSILTTIDPDKPYGQYTIKLMGEEGVVGILIPFTQNLKSTIDYYLEYRRSTKEEGLAINIPYFRNIPEQLSQTLYRRNSLVPTYLLGYLDEKNRERHDLFPPNTALIDRTNEIMIKVKSINQQTQTLDFIIINCYQKYQLIPHRAGNQSNISLNIFENDLRGENNTTKPLTIKEDFTVENASLCFNKKYMIDQSTIAIQQGNLFLSSPQFNFLSSEEVAPSKDVNNSFTTIATINNPNLPDSQLEFQVAEQNVDKDPQDNKDQSISKKLTYQFHVVPSFEEGKNDLEPFMISVKDKDINNKDFNHLEAEKGKTLIFTSNIANNSRNPDGNKSIEFFVKWDIQDEKGNNVIPPFRQRHEGIPPKTLDDANPATLTWTIPQDLPTGNYKVILAVDSNNRLQEFNENNNMIYRYFSVVE